MLSTIPNTSLQGRWLRPTPFSANRFLFATVIPGRCR